MPLPKEEEYYVLSDLLEWPEEDRVELIDGLPLLMAPPRRVHQHIVFALGLQLGNFLAGKPCQAYPAPFAVRPLAKPGDSPDRVDTVVEPDLSVICDREKLDELGCVGAPDLVIEVLSPSTARQDRVVKFRLYQKAGVREYWLVDPDRRMVQVYTLEEGQYSAAEVYLESAEVPVGVLEGCVVDLSRVFPEPGA